MNHDLDNDKTTQAERVGRGTSSKKSAELMGSKNDKVNEERRAEDLKDMLESFHLVRANSDAPKTESPTASPSTSSSSSLMEDFPPSTESPFTREIKEGEEQEEEKETDCQVNQTDATTKLTEMGLSFTSDNPSCHLRRTKTLDVNWSLTVPTRHDNATTRKPSSSSSSRLTIRMTKSSDGTKDTKKTPERTAHVMDESQTTRDQRRRNRRKTSTNTENLLSSPNTPRRSRSAARLKGGASSSSSLGMSARRSRSATRLLAEDKDPSSHHRRRRSRSSKRTPTVDSVDKSEVAVVAGNDGCTSTPQGCRSRCSHRRLMTTTTNAVTTGGTDTDDSTTLKNTKRSRSSNRRLAGTGNSSDPEKNANPNPSATPRRSRSNNRRLVTGATNSENDEDTDGTSHKTRRSRSSNRRLGIGASNNGTTKSDDSEDTDGTTHKPRRSRSLNRGLGTGAKNGTTKSDDDDDTDGTAHKPRRCRSNIRRLGGSNADENTAIPSRRSRSSNRRLQSNREQDSTTTTDNRRSRSVNRRLGNASDHKARESSVGGSRTLNKSNPTLDYNGKSNESSKPEQKPQREPDSNIGHARRPGRRDRKKTGNGPSKQDNGQTTRVSNYSVSRNQLQQAVLNGATPKDNNHSEIERKDDDDNDDNDDVGDDDVQDDVATKVTKTKGRCDIDNGENTEEEEKEVKEERSSIRFSNLVPVKFAFTAVGTALQAAESAAGRAKYAAETAAGTAKYAAESAAGTALYAASVAGKAQSTVVQTVLGGAANRSSLAKNTRRDPVE